MEGTQRDIYNISQGALGDCQNVHKVARDFSVEFLCSRMFQLMPAIPCIFFFLPLFSFGKE